ncbi:PIN domain-containing protein [Rhizohabitans arisaemae]|uniref:PIN domain-containing protein n=1 Tax=Rhizohabitans arisaemae TaxID=2720610 RepID=UPI0024B0A50E|nr:PIN domain-containing protein [Rhizohabitans arisaemae]
MTVYLVDKSAWEAARRDPVARAEMNLILNADTVATCHMAMLEVLYSARNPVDYERLRFAQLSLKQLPDPAAGSYAEDMAWVMDRALDVQRLLAPQGLWRRPPQDLIIAACAERVGATLLHIDKDFPLIAKITGQAERRLATGA